MQRTIKAGILLLVLVVPAFVFIFLKVFGENHFTLKTYYPLTDSLTGQVRTESRPAITGSGMVQDTVFYTVPSVKAVTEGNRPVNSAILNDKISIVSFFEDNCDSVCRQRAFQLSRLPDLFRDQKEVIILSFASRPQSFIHQLKTDNAIAPGRWETWLVKPDELSAIATNAYRLKDQQPGNSETFQFTDQLILVDKAGHIRGYYGALDKKEMERLILEIRVLLDVYAKQ